MSEGGGRQLPYIAAGVALMTVQPMLVTMSQNAEGRLDYSPVSATLLTECLKIGISLGMLGLSAERRPGRVDVIELLRYAVPAGIYFVNNILVFLILERVDATTFQLLSQLKTVFTGLLFRFFLGRKLTMVQYLAIWQLTCGSATSHIPLCSTMLSKEATAEDWTSFSGLGLSTVSCMLSACGGIYSEKLLKGRVKESIHWQNVQLYSWGIVFNLLGAASSGGPGLDRGLFDGYNPWACLVVLNNALNGLAISAILKYADNIARVYAHTAAMLVTMLLSVVFFGRRPTPQVIIAVSIVAASAVQYNLRPEHLDSASIAAVSPSTRDAESKV